jgi:proteasome lid subunit RPN8/RPN11
MEFTIATTALTTIIEHAAAAAPHEACGIVVGSATAIAAAIPARNIAARPATSFEIDPQTLIDVQRTARRDGAEVVGWYHSHPNGVAAPSATDAARAAGDDRLWLIAAAGQVAAWRAGAGGAVHGRFTPVALVAA